MRWSCGVNLYSTAVTQSENNFSFFWLTLLSCYHRSLSSHSCLTGAALSLSLWVHAGRIKYSLEKYFTMTIMLISADFSGGRLQQLTHSLTHTPTHTHTCAHTLTCTHTSIHIHTYTNTHTLSLRTTGFYLTIFNTKSDLRMYVHTCWQNSNVSICFSLFFLQNWIFVGRKALNYHANEVGQWNSGLNPHIWE